MYQLEFARLTRCCFRLARGDMDTTSCLLLEGDIGNQAFAHPLYLLQDGVDVQRHKTLIFLLRFAILLLYIWLIHCHPETRDAVPP